MLSKSCRAPQVPALEIVAEPPQEAGQEIGIILKRNTKSNHCKERKELLRPLLGTGKQQNGTQLSLQTNP